MASERPASGEDSLIARYFKPLATDPGAFDLGDDAAILKALGDDIVVTTDAIVEGVHFLPDDPPDTIARKALGVNLSDLAAKGAAPAGCVLTLALRTADEAWLSAFAQALGEDTAKFGCPLLGGDTVSTPGPLMISVTAFGRVPSGKMVRRNGAKPGDLVVVTGTIGDAALGLDVLRQGTADARCRCRGEGNADRTLSGAAAAHSAGVGGSRSRACGDGCVRRSRRRSRQAVQRLRRVGDDSCGAHPVVARPPRRWWRAALSASKPSSPVAMITRSCVRFRRAALMRSSRRRGRSGLPSP